MGCDIHASVEFKDYIGHDGKPAYCCFAHNVGINRNYALFGLMAGVRDYNKSAIFQPKGIPANLSWQVESDYTLFISDDNGEDYCTATDAQRYINSGDSVMYNDRRVTHPDWHSPSWLTVVELEQVAAAYQKNEGEAYMPLIAIIAMMKVIDGDTPGKSRLTFWFDN